VHQFDFAFLFKIINSILILLFSDTVSQLERIMSSPRYGRSRSRSFSPPPRGGYREREVSPPPSNSYGGGVRERFDRRDEERDRRYGGDRVMRKRYGSRSPPGYGESLLVEFQEQDAFGESSECLDEMVVYERPVLRVLTFFLKLSP
jgi:hypothetical protein